VFVRYVIHHASNWDVILKRSPKFCVSGNIGIVENGIIEFEESVKVCDLDQPYFLGRAVQWFVDKVHYDLEREQVLEGPRSATLLRMEQGWSKSTLMIVVGLSAAEKGHHKGRCQGEAVGGCR
jgi:hypothetical protein